MWKIKTSLQTNSIVKQNDGDHKELILYYASIYCECEIQSNCTLIYIPFPLLYLGLVKDISSTRRKTGTLDLGADHEQAVVVHAGLEISNRKALSILKSNAATWLHV